MTAATRTLWLWIAYDGSKWTAELSIDPQGEHVIHVATDPSSCLGAELLARAWARRNHFTEII